MATGTTIDDDGPVDPWDQQPDEPDEHHTWFTAYLAFGPARSLRVTSAKVGKSRRHIERVAARWQWMSRANAHDGEQARQWSADMAVRRRDMAERHARVAVAFQNKVVTRLQTLDPDRLSAADLARWVEVATRLERGALGLPETTLGHTGADGGPVEVASMTEDERRQRLAELRAELDRRIGGPP